MKIQVGTMSRNLYLLAASVFLLSLLSCAVSVAPNPLQPSVPINGPWWRMLSLVLLLLSLVIALAAVLATMFEQVERRSQDRMKRELQQDLANLTRHHRRK
jgi:hypothetical protein